MGMTRRALLGRIALAPVAALAAIRLLRLPPGWAVIETATSHGEVIARRVMRASEAIARYPHLADDIGRRLAGR
jgi:hypothetical protein